MSINSGGPHILLFERDKQLTPLLVSQFQLAGYECHPARTAVEVFDAIARNPIRLILVNLAQPAANRREFWVALDTQKKGRGVQVLTFRCMNIAGYGSYDFDDTPHTVPTDIEVDGMVGIMNLVDAVRSRIPGPFAGSFSQIATTGASAQDSATQDMASNSMRSTPPTFVTPAASNSTSAGTVKPMGRNRTDNPEPGFTDKIRAVIYPGSRNFSLTPENSSRTTAPQEQESGLAQLSRMVHESLRAETDDSSHAGYLKRSASPLTEPIEQQAESQIDQTNNNGVNTYTQSTVLQQTQLTDATSISALSLRASPIEDTPSERTQEYRNTHVGTQSLQPEDIVPVAPIVSTSSSVSHLASRTVVAAAEEKSQVMTDAQNVEARNNPAKAGEEDAIASALAEIPGLSPKEIPNQSPSADRTSDDMLLDIVQSLPPMTSLPRSEAQPTSSVLSRRATRSLGSVLLEGHLVPQHRLEVAQQVQRMLRGVDLNYQLGEILLMFKLLTPDQLLAASLVSYGLISTAQISALGRIRQELHSIGLEYDLESLLILFRILTPDQIREVRTSWTG
jgi:hypothetical protein